MKTDSQKLGRMRSRYSVDPEYRAKIRARQSLRYANDASFRDAQSAKAIAGYADPEKKPIKQARMRQYGKTEFALQSQRLRQASQPYKDKRKAIQATREYQQKRRKQSRDRYHKSPSSRLACIFRNRIRQALRDNNASKTDASLKMAGCTWAELRGHIESKFTGGMSWAILKEIHIDHIRPVSSFNLNDPQQQKECFHFSNLQPLWATDNLQKGSRTDWAKKEG